METVIGAPNAGDTAWILTSAALVLLMTPGLAFFYGGMVRGKNVLNMIMMSISAMGLVGVLWSLYGYSEAFGDNKFGVIGDPAQFFRCGHRALDQGNIVGTRLHGARCFGEMGDPDLPGQREEFVLAVEQGQLAAVAGGELPDRERRSRRHSSRTPSSGSATV